MPQTKGEVFHFSIASLAGDLMSALKDSLPERPLTRAEIAGAEKSFAGVRNGQLRAEIYEKTHPREAEQIRAQLRDLNYPKAG